MQVHTFREACCKMPRNETASERLLLFTLLSPLCISTYRYQSSTHSTAHGILIIFCLKQQKQTIAFAVVGVPPSPRYVVCFHGNLIKDGFNWKEEPWMSNINKKHLKKIITGRMALQSKDITKDWFYASMKHCVCNIQNKHTVKVL